MQWPGSECSDPALAKLLIWKQLKRALRTGSRMEDEEEADENKCSVTTKGNQNPYTEKNTTG